MNKKWLLLPLTVASMSAQAASIEALNVEAGLAYAHTEDNDRSTDAGLVDVRLGLPVVDALGVNVTVAYSDANEPGDASSTIGTYGLELVHRYDDWLRVDAEYRFFDIEQEVSGRTFDQEVDVVSGGFDLYLSNFDLGTEYRNVENGAFEAVDLEVANYLSDNTRIAIQFGVADADTVGAELELQPAFLQNQVAVVLAAERDNEFDDNTFGVRVSYAFGTNVDLKERIRKYR